MPLPGQWAADRQNPHKFPDPGATGDNSVSRWSQRLSLSLAFCSSLTQITAPASPLWQTPLLSLQAVFWSRTSPKTLFQIFLLFSWKSVQEGSCTNPACLKKTLKALPVVLVSPMKLNYSSSFAGNANVIADFLNKQLHHYNNHQDFYYFWPFPQQTKTIGIQSGMGNCNIFFFRQVRYLGVSF